MNLNLNLNLNFVSFLAGIRTTYCIGRAGLVKKRIFSVDSNRCRANKRLLLPRAIHIEVNKESVRTTIAMFCCHKNCFYCNCDELLLGENRRDWSFL